VRLAPHARFSAAEQAAMYAELFQRRWNFEAPGKAHLHEVFELLREFMTGSVVFLDEQPIAIQVLYRVESPKWVSVEYINGGVDPVQRTSALAACSVSSTPRRPGPRRGRWANRCVTPLAGRIVSTRIAGATECRSIRCKDEYTQAATAPSASS